MTIVNKKWKEADILADALGERSLREGADWLNEKLPMEYRRSHASIANWLDCIFPFPIYFADALVRFYAPGDARHELGKMVLARKGVSAILMPSPLGEQVDPKVNGKKKS